MGNKIAEFVKVFDANRYFEELRFNKNHHLGTGDVRITIGMQEELIARFEELESLLAKTLPLLERSKNIINDQVPGVPHLIEGALDSLRIEIEEALTKIVMVDATA